MKTKFNGILTLLLAFTVHFAFAQKTVSGTVSDDSGPLPGVSVLIKGTTTGTETDFDGKYIMVANKGDVLQYSYVGMTTAFKTVGNANVINVVMAVSSENVLEEVVVTAYGIKRAKKSLTYQTQKVSDDELLMTAPNSAGSALAGKVAGLQINIQDNGVNPTTQVLLRGLRSISQSNSALFVIDGTIATQGAFDGINPQDILSMNILKGANAAALYGSRAGNGAVIVTTKQGATDSFKFGINSATTLENVAYMPVMQTEYGTGWQGVYNPVENTNWGPRFDGTVRQIGPTFADGTFQAVPYAPVKDNLKNFYDTGITLNNTVYFSGGTDNSKYYMSIGDKRTTGIVPKDSYDVNTFRVNASTKFGKVTVGVNSNFSMDDQSITGDEIGDQGRQLYWFVLNTPANIPLEEYRNWETDLYASPDGYFNAYYQNPYWAIDTNRNEDKGHRINGNITAGWDATDWLNLRGTMGLTKRNLRGKEWRAAQDYDPTLQPAHQAVSSWVEDSESQYSFYTMDFVSTSSFNFKEDFDLNVIVGAANESMDYHATSIRSNNMLIPDWFDISNGTAGNLNITTSKKRGFGVFGDVNLGYKDFLYVYGSGRQDWTSVLSDDQNSYFYPSFGVSLVASEAIPGLKGNSFLNYLKLTFSNSTVYNDTSPFSINERYSQSSSFPFGSTNGFYQSGTAVDDLIKKEKLNTNEFGLNIGLFNNRLTADLSYFLTKTKNLITYISPSTASGADNLFTNIGELSGKGIEASIGAKIFDGDFKWSTNINYTSNETEVVEINDPDTDDEQVATYTWHNMGIYAVEGELYPQLQGSSYERDPQGRVIIDPATGNPLIGEYKSFGRVTPKHIVGLTNSFSYKNFTLTATLDYRTGHVYYSQIADMMEFTGRSMESVSSNRQDFVWPDSVIELPDGSFVENTNVQITGGRQNFWNNHYNEIAENYVIDATALKIRELVLNYEVPEKLFSNSALSKINVGLISRNLLTWLPTENRFADPEFGNSRNNNIGVGGYIQSPPTRTFGFKINVEF